MPVFYNPLTRDPSELKLLGVRRVDKDDPFYKFRAGMAYGSKESAIMADISGPIAWFDNGELFMARSTGNFDMHEVSNDTQPVYSHGINWGAAYFSTKESAERWVFNGNSEVRNNGVEYDSLCDVWFVHYHY